MKFDKKLNEDEVIYTLERCSDVQREAIDHVYVCPVCPYAVNVDEHGGLPCESLAPLMDDALALLKEQEPVEPKKRDVDYGNLKSWAWICGVCGGDVIWGRRYCPDCGRAVKWNEEPYCT